MNVLFLIFNRPDETRKSFETIRQAKPAKLFIAADGPRTSQEKATCDEARTIATSVDWPCEVVIRFQETNLGCRMHVSSAISWFFDHVEEGIILEDDCLPDPTFFLFASAMLEKYRNDARMMHVSGANFQFGNFRGGRPPASYYFSRCPHIWGWATWKRAWQAYDVEMKDLEDYLSSGKIYSLFKDAKVAKFWISLFRHIKNKKVDTWDAQWAFAIMKNEGLAIMPNVNLVENIGFGSSSTHTEGSEDFRKQAAEPLTAIIHPDSIAPDLEADDFLAKAIYIEPLWKKLFRRLKIR